MGFEYLIGEAAGQESLKSNVKLGGSLKRPQYYGRLLKALLLPLLERRKA